MQSFNQYYELFNRELNLEIEKLKLREPLHLYQPVVYTLNMGGKRLRPLLVLMAYNLFGTDFSKAMPAAMAIEMFHNFTLLHDDIMDNADLRRNKETVHVAYSPNTAILSGDAMSILSYEFITRIESPNYQNIMMLYTQTALQICEGQQYDMEFEKRERVSEAEYLCMIGLKTAVLLAASLKIGALLANANENDADWLYQFGYNLGMAFQLQDDLLDTFGDQDAFGKAIGGDIVANKKTYLAIKAFELAHNENLEKLNYWYALTNCNRQQKVTEVKSVFENLDISYLTRSKMETYYQQAIGCLENVDLGEQEKAGLLILAQKLMLREN